jgi:hypothetical protein
MLWSCHTCWNLCLWCSAYTGSLSSCLVLICLSSTCLSSKCLSSTCLSGENTQPFTWLSCLIFFNRNFLSVSLFMENLKPFPIYTKLLLGNSSVSRTLGLLSRVTPLHALHRRNTENSKQIFPEKELRSFSPYFHIHVSVRELYIPTNSLPILLQENMWTDSGNI